MKKFLVSVFAIMAIAFSASAQNSSTHSFSLRTLYGLEYSYEHQWDGGMSLIGRIGGGSDMSGRSQYYTYGQGFNVMVEPRYYLNDEDFFSVKVNGAILYVTVGNLAVPETKLSLVLYHEREGQLQLAETLYLLVECRGGASREEEALLEIVHGGVCSYYTKRHGHLGR